MDDRSILIATRAFFGVADGNRVVVRKGQLARADHPVVAGNETCFVPIETKIDYDTAEQKQAVEGDPAAT